MIAAIIGGFVGLLVGAITGVVVASKIADENAGAAVIPLAVIGGGFFAIVGAIAAWLIFG